MLQINDEVWNAWQRDVTVKHGSKRFIVPLDLWYLGLSPAEISGVTFFRTQLNSDVPVRWNFEIRYVMFLPSGDYRWYYCLAVSPPTLITFFTTQQRDVYRARILISVLISVAYWYCKTNISAWVLKCVIGGYVRGTTVAPREVGSWKMDPSPPVP